MDTSEKTIKQLIYEKALFLIKYSPQTEKTLFIKLLKKGFPAEEILQVISRLKEKNLLNDTEYARLYAEELIRVKCVGYNKLIQKLTARGIKRDVADRISQETMEDFGGEMKVVRNYIFKNHNFFRDNYKAGEFARIKNKLYTNGFINIVEEELIIVLNDL